MDEVTDPFRRAPSDWVEALEQSEAECAAGLAVDGAPMRQRLKDSIASLKAGIAGEEHTSDPENVA